MNDKFTLIAAATGGFMLSVALSGVLTGAPVTKLQNLSMSTHELPHVQIVSKKANNQDN